MKSTRLKELGKNLLLACASILFILLLLEGGLRMAGYGNLEIYVPDPVVYWRLKPNQDCLTKVDRKPVHINSQGTRGPEFALPKPANTIRILCLGDSRTFGWGLTEAESYPGLLQSGLQEKIGPGTKIEVVNAGVNAWSYPQMFAYFREFGLKFSPDIVLLAGANLWTQFSESNSPEFVQQFLNRVRLKNFLRRFALYHYVVEVKLQKYYERYRTKFIPIDPKTDTLFKEAQQKDPSALFRKSIEDLCRLAQTNGIQPVLLYLPSTDDFITTNKESLLAYQAQLGASTNLGVKLIDTTAEIAPKGEALYFEGDRSHLNLEGTAIMSQRLVEEMVPVVKGRLAASPAKN